MTTMATDRLVDDYMRRLEAAAAHMQRARRAELVAEIREHIETALREEDAASEVAVRNVLERLGEPEEIVEAAEPAPAVSGRPTGKLEIAALVALVVPAIGWLFGIVLVLASRVWTRREKAVGIALALVPPLLPLLGVIAESASGPGSEVQTPIDRDVGVEEGDGGLGPVELVVFAFVFFAAGLPSALYLGWRLRR